MLDKLQLRLGHVAADGDDERRDLPLEHERPFAVGARYLKLEQQPRPLPPARPSEARRRHIE